MDREAFSEFLFNLDLALFADAEGHADAAAEAYMTASVACFDAFPLDSRESAALGVLLAAVEPLVTARAA